MAWSKSIIHWSDNGRVFISVVFTWHLPLAKTLASWYKQAGASVYIGGPAVDLMPDYMNVMADQVGGEFYPAPLTKHNADATFTSRGCIHQCSFCAVPRIEGELRELPSWQPAPIICDNNLLATSQSHFDQVIDRVRCFRSVDFNQGLDARLMNSHHIDRLKELKLPRIRLSFDHIGMESRVMTTLDTLLAAGFPKSRITCFVLFGFNDQPDDAIYRVMLLKAKGIRPFPQRYQAIEGEKALRKNAWVGVNWTHREMQKFQRYWSRQNWFSKVPYDEFIG